MQAGVDQKVLDDTELIALVRQTISYPPIEKLSAKVCRGQDGNS
jgi:hypothetical protein